MSETIAAIATPPGRGGIGIIRISGSLVIEIAQAIIGLIPVPRQVIYRIFKDTAGNEIDEGLAILFTTPHSFTGEDVLELQAHGSPIVLDLLLKNCFSLGARQARPGEFTERAYLNGKIDLIQAEAVADLIESNTEHAARLALRSLQGEFSRRISALIENLIQVRMYLEANLDFPDEDLAHFTTHDLSNDLAQIITETRQILTAARYGHVIHEGISVVIAGPPNVGKSSLFNALTQEDTAIVSSRPGTTRDVLKTVIQCNGVLINLTDTAGIHHSNDDIEQEGIRRAQAQMRNADLILWVTDITNIADNSYPELNLKCPVTFIRNKIDLLNLKPELKQSTFGIEIYLSAHTGSGINLLKDYLQQNINFNKNNEGIFTARRRHLDALERGLILLDAAHLGARQGIEIELIAEDLFRAQRIFGEITGQTHSSELLEKIFASFCIGK